MKLNNHNMPENSKNITPNRLALATAFFCSAVTLFLSLLIGLYFQLSLVLGLLIAGVLNLIICYWLFYEALERFIYRKVKVIYKNIHRLKQPLGKLMDKPDMNRNIIDEVETEVLQWAGEQTSEIEQLKKMEL